METWHGWLQGAVAQSVSRALQRPGTLPSGDAGVIAGPVAKAFSPTLPQRIVMA